MQKEKAKDAGLALILILLLFLWWLVGIHHPLIIVLSVAVLFCLLAPSVFTPFAVVWYGLSGVLGAVTSRILLTLIFLVVVVPVALARRLAGADPMLLKRWKKDDGSVFVERHHTFVKEDIDDPY